MPPATRLALAPGERVSVTGDVHLDPADPGRAAAFLAFLARARAEADRLVLLGDVFDYWVGPRHARGCAYAPVVAAFEAAAAAGFPIDFLAGNRDFLGPRELTSIGLRVHGDALLLERPGRRTLVTHGDLLVLGDHGYRRYRRVVRSAAFRLGYRVVPTWFRLLVAAVLRRASRRKLRRVTPLAFPLDLELCAAWLAHHAADELLCGHLHRAERHVHPGGGVTRMLPGWSDDGAPHFALGGQGEAELRAS